MEKHEGKFMKGRWKGCCKFMVVVLMSLTGCMAQFSVLPEKPEKYALSGQNITLVYTIKDTTEKNVNPNTIRLKVQRSKKPVAYSMLFVITLNDDKVGKIELQNSDEGLPLERYAGRVSVDYKQPVLNFYLTNITVADFDWNYQVEAKAKGRKRQFDEKNIKSIMLKEAKPPTIYIQSFFPSYMMKQGHTSDFICRASGTPLPNVKWMVGNKVKGIGYGQASMPIRNAETTDTENYVCEAENVGGLAKKTMSLTVAYIEYGQNRATSEVIQIVSGGKINTKCNIDGYPSPKYQWSGPDNLVTRSTRELLQRKTKSFGNYTCQATNPAGTLEYVAQVKEIAPADGNKTRTEAKRSEDEGTSSSFASSRTNNYFLFCILHSILMILCSFLFT